MRFYFPLGSYPLGHIDPRTQWHVNTTIFLITCVLGRLGSWVRVGGGGGGVKEERLGSCVWGGGRDGGERRDVGELCVCGWRWGERREVLHVILFRGGGGGSKYFGKAPCSSWRSQLRVYWGGGVWGRASPRIFFKMVQPYLKISQTPCNFSIPLKSFSTPPKIYQPYRKKLNPSRKTFNPS